VTGRYGWPIVERGIACGCRGHGNSTRPHGAHAISVTIFFRSSGMRNAILARVALRQRNLGLGPPLLPAQTKILPLLKRHRTRP